MGFRNLLQTVGAETIGVLGSDHGQRRDIYPQICAPAVLTGVAAEKASASAADFLHRRNL